MKQFFHFCYSACFASMQNWQLALEDAMKCVAKDSNFIKGYFRLSIAQTELGQFEDAEITLRAVLAKEPGNSHYFY
jgi:tetratricopeptide (TPR) repeat protein